MASKSVTRAITGNNGSYSRILGNFRGVDLSSDPSQVAPDRMAYSVNMWRDYESENGGAIETIPGFRKLFGLGGKIHGIFAFGKDYIVVHSGKRLYRIPKDKIETEGFDATTYKLYVVEEGKEDKEDNRQYDIMNEADSSAFEYNGKLYILDGVAYRYVTNDENDKTVHNVADENAYIPTSYYNYKPYEQRNMLQTKFINKKTFLRENPVNRAIPVKKYLNVNRIPFTDNVQISSSECGGKVYLPVKYTEIAGIFKAEYKCVLFGSYDKELFGIVEIIDGSFANSHIEQIVIDGDIGEIPAYSFANCKNLKRVVIKGSWTGGYKDGEDIDKNPYNVTIQPNAFYGCTGLREIWFFGMPRLIFDSATDTKKAYFEKASTKITLYGAAYKSYSVTSENALTNELPEQIERYEYDVTEVLTAYVGEGCHTGFGKGGTTPEIIPIDGESGIENLVESVDGWNFTPNTPYAFSLLGYEKDALDRYKYKPVFIYDRDSGVTNYEGELWWYNFTIMDPCTKIADIKVNGKSLDPDEFVENKETLEDDGNEYVTSVDILLPRSFTEEDVEIYGEGELNNFATVKDMADIYQSTTLSKDANTVAAIGGCTVSCAFDGRVFFTGNPELPNTVFYTHRDLTGANNPTYIGVYNYINDGVGSIPNVAMIAASSMLMVFKQDTTLEGSVFYHTGQDNADTTSQDLIPRLYPSVQGVAGIGCLGAACNFADDAVFISKKGLEAIGKEQVNLERTIQHRSGRIDASLWHTIGKDTKLAEWKGYLVVLTKGGKMYLADSRRVALMQSTGEYQYEWFYLDGIGSYYGDKEKYVYVDTANPYVVIEGENVPLIGATINGYTIALADGDITSADTVINSFYPQEEGGVPVDYIVKKVMSDGVEEEKALLVEKTSEKTGGTFSPACVVMEHDGNLYFGCENGDVCVFNTDKRGVAYTNPYSGDTASVDITEIHPAWYNRCGHRYLSGFSTLADNCGYPHFNKSTCGKTLTIKAKSLRNSAFSLRARSNREDWKDIGRYVSAECDFSYLDFNNANFQTQKQQIFSSREKMKKWAEKQLYFFSDGFCEPFGIYNLAYVFEIVGKVK